MASARCARLAALLGPLLVTACGPSDEATERAAVAEKIDALRNIPAEDTSSRVRAVDALRRVPARTAEGVAARDACASAFAALAEGMRLTERAQTGLAPGSTALAEDTLRAASSANALLDQADALLDRCADASAALRVTR